MKLTLSIVLIIIGYTSSYLWLMAKNIKGGYKHTLPDYYLGLFLCIIPAITFDKVEEAINEALHNGGNDALESK